MYRVVQDGSGELTPAEKRRDKQAEMQKAKQSKADMVTNAKLLANFNYVMGNIEEFKAATDSEASIIYVKDLKSCEKIIELYSWLYTHTDLLRSLLGLSRTQTEIVDIYDAHRIITETHRFMCNQGCSANKAILWHIDWEKSPNNNRNKFK